MRFPLPHRVPPVSLALVALLAACSDGGDPSAVADAAEASDVSTLADATPDAGPAADVELARDAELDGAVDPGDAAADGGPSDGGTSAGLSLIPGTGITLGTITLTVGMDTFQSVNAALATATRTRIIDETTRSYEYTLNDQRPPLVLRIWFANTNLDQNDTPPNDVDGNDRILWIAVDTGVTPAGIGVGSTRSEVETAYGVAPHTVPLTDPSGTLAQYYGRGLLVAYAPNDEVRSITICRAYPSVPDGTIDPTRARVRFAGGELKGFIGLGNNGTSDRDVRALLGAPDGSGRISLNGTPLEAISYAFIGVEVFFTTISSNTLFFTIHTPFYGVTGGPGLGLGSSRTEMDTYLSGLGYSTRVSSNPQFVCYESGNMPNLGVTYSASATVASSITIALPQCP